MNFIKTIYYSQYYELKKTGRDPQKGRINGTLLSATVIILNLASMIIILYKTSPSSRIILFFKELVSGYSGNGKMLGELFGAILIAGIGSLLHVTIGSRSSYNRIAENYMQLPEEVQARTVKRSLLIFIVSFGLFLVLMFFS